MIAFARLDLFFFSQVKTCIYFRKKANGEGALRYMEDA